MLVIPTEGVVTLVGAEIASVHLNVVQVDRIPGGSVQPCCSPQQLILLYQKQKTNTDEPIIQGGKEQKYCLRKQDGKTLADLKTREGAVEWADHWFQEVAV